MSSPLRARPVNAREPGLSFHDIFQNHWPGGEIVQKILFRAPVQVRVLDGLLERICQKSSTREFFPDERLVIEAERM